MGFCRTNLFKRLESGGPAFLQSVQRHILRNFIFLYAIENDLPLPLGTQDAELLDATVGDDDLEEAQLRIDSEDEEAQDVASGQLTNLTEKQQYAQRAAEVYDQYRNQFKRRFKWLRSSLFVGELEEDLRKDADALLAVLSKCGEWDPRKDTKLRLLEELIGKSHPKEKVLVFSQFADTVEYLLKELEARGVDHIAGATGDSPDPTMLAWRFSPRSNNKIANISAEEELRVLIATDVLSEGQNLQDCSTIVNFDLPWAIIRLIQRAGRVDRIGQTSPEIRCYSFLPTDGVERVIRLRNRVRRRLQENAEVVGTDESFFEDDAEDSLILDLYNEKAGILDGDGDTEVDLASYAYQIWKNAIDADPKLQKLISELPAVVYSTRAHEKESELPEGVLVYIRTGQGNDSLGWINRQGESVTESQLAILRAAECRPDAPALPRDREHHDLVRRGVELIAAEEKNVGGQLGRPSGARFRTYERLKQYADQQKGTLFLSPDLLVAIDEIYRYPLRQVAIDTLNRQLRSGISNDTLAELVLSLREDGRLCIIHEEEEEVEPQIICSLGLFDAKGKG
jgi:hypothetical protein